MPHAFISCVSVSIVYIISNMVVAGTNMCGLQMISLANLSGYYATIRDFFAEDWVIISSTEAQYPTIENENNVPFIF